MPRDEPRDPVGQRPPGREVRGQPGLVAPGERAGRPVPSGPGGRAAGAAPDAGAAEALDVLLGRTLRAMRHHWSPNPAGIDLAPHQGRALRIVADCGPLRLSELAERLRIAPRSATEVADALQERGFVARSPDPGDRRAVLLDVTPAGHEAAAAVAAARAAGAEAYFGRLGAADRAELARILHLLLDAEPPPNQPPI